MKPFLKNQHGAMFGLDARITLIIFGALAAVTGVIMSNVAPEANSTALATDLNNVSQAYENYILDTGRNPAYLSKANKAKENFMVLIENPKTFGWQGPYLLLGNNKHPKYGYYGLVEGEFNTAGAPPVIPCSASSSCVVWLKLTEVPTDLAMDMDKRMDGEISAQKGRLRMDDLGATSDIYYMIGRKQSR